MQSQKSSDNLTPYQAEDYDDNILSTLPYYKSFHQEIINLVKVANINPKIWLDTGCGTGTFVKKAVKEFPNTEFILVDPSFHMIKQAQQNITCQKNIKFLECCSSENLTWNNNEKPDIITAIQCHHYLPLDGRFKATKKCYNILKEEGIYFTFENIRPLTETGTEIVKKYVSYFQLANGKNESEVEQYISRFDSKHFPITIEEHLTLLRKIGFKTVEILWYSYMQAGFYCIK